MPRWITNNPPIPTNTSASGVWSLSEQFGYKKAGTWPLPPSDIYFKYNTLLLHGTGTNAANNNTIVDSNATPKTITRNGNVKPGSISPFSLNGGWSNYFNGSTDSLTIASPASTLIDWYTSSFTIEYWIYPNSFNTGGNGSDPVTIGNMSITDTSNYWSFGPLSSGVVRFYYYNGSIQGFSTTATIPLKTWTHLAFVNNAGSLTIYINGVSSATANIVGSTPLSGSGLPLAIGKAGSVAFNGYLSNIRITGSAVYTAAFTPPTAQLTAITNTSLLTGQSNRFVDTSSSPKTLTVNGAPTVQAFNPFGRTTAYSTSTETGSLYFDGTGDYLTSPNSTDFSFGTGDFTVEFWMYVNTAWTSNNGPGIGQKAGDGTNGWVIYRNTSINTTVMSIRITQDLDYATTVTPTPYSWQHWAVVRSGTTLTWYCNGVACGVSTGVSQNITDTSGTMNIGRAQTWTTDFNGYLSNVRVVKGTAVYTAAFTPPTAPLTAISGTTLLLKGTDAGIYDSTGLNDLETISTTQISTTQSKYGGSSIYFNGSSYLSVPTSSNFGFGTADFTIETWIYPTSNAGTGIGPIAEFRTAIAAQATAIRINASNQIHFYDGPANVDTIFTTVVATLNVWQHIAIVRYSNRVYAYINGVLAGSVAVTSDLGSTQPILIGSLLNAGYIYTGYMSDFRITKGVARYTAAFTPPTATFLDTISA
jgi:hypothetical protein